jgi:hypothetical protein
VEADTRKKRRWAEADVRKKKWAGKGGWTSQY